MDELVAWALDQLACEYGLLDPHSPRNVKERGGSRGISYYTVRQPGRALHIKVGNDSTDEIFAREVVGIGRVPAAVRPQVLAAFGHMDVDEHSPVLFIVQPLYHQVRFASADRFAQWTMALAAADTAAALWCEERLHLDLNTTIFFTEARPHRRLVLLDFNDVVRWPPDDPAERAPVFYDGHHPDLAPVGPHPVTVGAVAARVQGHEDRLLAYACAHLLAYAAGNPVTAAGGADARLEAALADRFPVPRDTLHTVVAALQDDPAARPPLSELRSVLAAAAGTLAPGGTSADVLRSACRSYLSERSSHDGGVA